MAIVGTAIYGLTGTLAGGGVIGISLVIGAIAAVRSVQSEIARKEYQRTRPFTPQVSARAAPPTIVRKGEACASTPSLGTAGTGAADAGEGDRGQPHGNHFDVVYLLANWLCTWTR